MLRTTLVFSALLFLSSVGNAQLPPDAKQILNQLPEKKLTVDFVVAKAFASSDTIRAIHAQALAIEAGYWRSLAPTETVLSAGASYAKNENRNASVFDPRERRLFEIGASKYLKTGTLLGVQLSELNQTLQPENTFMPPDIAAAKVTIAQNILKDAFGSMTRKQIQAGKLLKEASELTYRQELQNWTLDFINVYYGAWLSQAQLRAAKSELARRKRLLKVTQLKLNRGTAERPDLLQVESAHLQAQAALDQSTHDLQKLWRELVTNLKLPQTWLAISAEDIPLTLDDPQARALALCADKSNFETSRSVSLNEKLWGKRVAATEKVVSASKNSLLPELSIEGSYGSTGLIDGFPERSSKAIGMQNPEWMIGLRLKMPIERYAAKSELAQNASQHQQNLALAAKAKTDHGNNWLTGCAQLKTLISNKDLLEDAVKSLTTRAELEERRFNIGRTTTFNVIQAGDEKALAELRLNELRTALNRSAWEILKLNGEVESYLERVVKTASSIEFKD